MKKIMLLARDPGGANTVIPLVGPLIAEGYEVSLFGKDAALKRYRQMGLNGLDIAKYLQVIDVNGWVDFLHKEKPNFIITGTSGDDFSERNLWEAARRCNIQTFAILDQWMNYGIRFSRYRLSEKEKYEENKQHPYLPDRILVMDNEARQQMVNEGIENSQILISGQPYFDMVMEQKNNIDMEIINDIRRQIGYIKGDFCICYVSEPMSLDYPEKYHGDSYWGYDEKTNCRAILEILSSIAPSYEGKINFLIKQHPREKLNNYHEIMNEFNSGPIMVSVLKETDSWPLLMLSDLVCGMSSMLLLEAVLLGRPVLSVQIGLKKENPLILDRLGILGSILNKVELDHSLRRILLDNQLPTIAWQVRPGAVQNVIRYMEELL